MGNSRGKVRRALAGVELLKGARIGEALQRAGYAASTARAAKGNGLTAERCLADAAEVFPDCDPANILRGARAALERKLSDFHRDASVRDRTRLGEIARVVQVTEEFYGASDPARGDARDTADRLDYLAALQAELTRRGISVQRAPVIDAGPETSPKPEKETDPRG